MCSIVKTSRIASRLSEKNFNMPDVIQGVLWQAHFDESGKLADPAGVVAFGGCVGPQEAVHKLSLEWEQYLHGAGLSYTSMKDAVHFRGRTQDGKTIQRNAIRLCAAWRNCLLIVRSSWSPRRLPQRNSRRYLRIRKRSFGTTRNTAARGLRHGYS